MITINGMSNFTNQEIHRAYSIICNRYDIAVGRRLNVDKRTRVGNLAIFLSRKVNKMDIYTKQYDRRKNKYHFSNVLVSPIYLDYKKNYNSIKYISDTHISFGGRNHHAKNDRDIKILTILSKHFKKL